MARLDDPIGRPPYGGEVSSDWSRRFSSGRRLEQEMRRVEKISVIVATWNHAHHVRQALESVDAAIGYLKRQPEGFALDVEVIVVDDASEDGTRPILEEYARGQPSYHLLLRGRPANPACLCNLGVAIAAGDIL